MKIENSIVTKLPAAPEYLQGILAIGATCEVSELMANIFGLGLRAVESELKEDGIKKEDLLSLTLICTSDGTVSFSCDDPYVAGMQFDVAILVIDRIRAVGDTRFWVYALIEELVHHYWRIENETKVKYKAVKIAQRVDESIDLDLLKTWEVNWE